MNDTGIDDHIVYKPALMNLHEESYAGNERPDG